ncbi:hypothetical protein BKA93DRAFT_830389 [Sparassis latifolia]
MTSQLPISMATINDLPNELLLEIIPHLTLQALIAARAINKKWRMLVAIAYRDLCPTRRRLLQLYTDTIASPAFHATRDEIVTHLWPFDREAYVAALEAATPLPLPDDFRMWLLEWPERAVIGWYWPGLTSAYNFQATLARATGAYLLERPDDALGSILLNKDGSVISHRPLRGEDLILNDHWVWFVDLHCDPCDRYAITTSLFIAGKGVGEKVVGQVRYNVVGRLIQSEHGAPCWLDFLRGELRYQESLM